MIKIRARHEKYVELPIEFHTIGELASTLPRRFNFSGRAIILEDGVVLPPGTRVKPWAEYTFLRCLPAREVERRVEYAAPKTDDQPVFQFTQGIGVPYQLQVKEHAKRLAQWEERQKKAVVTIVPDPGPMTDPVDFEKWLEGLNIPCEREGELIL